MSNAYVLSSAMPEINPSSETVCLRNNAVRGGAGYDLAQLPQSRGEKSN